MGEKHALPFIYIIRQCYLLWQDWIHNARYNPFAWINNYTCVKECLSPALHTEVVRLQPNVMNYYGLITFLVHKQYLLTFSNEKCHPKWFRIRYPRFKITLKLSFTIHISHSNLLLLHDWCVDLKGRFSLEYMIVLIIIIIVLTLCLTLGEEAFDHQTCSCEVGLYYDTNIILYFLYISKNQLKVPLSCVLKYVSRLACYNICFRFLFVCKGGSANTVFNVCCASIIVKYVVEQLFLWLQNGINKTLKIGSEMT